MLGQARLPQDRLEARDDFGRRDGHRGLRERGHDAAPSARGGEKDVETGVGDPGVEVQITNMINKKH
jgi:hypothetical protein